MTGSGNAPGAPAQGGAGGAAPRYITQPTDDPVWITDPYRVFFPLGLVVGTFGLLLWPMHYLGWWPVNPALQHPRLLIFGFGGAFVFGFLGTAWPRFLEAEALKRWEFFGLVILWALSQLSYAKVAIGAGDLLGAGACLWLLFVLGRRLFGGGKDLPPPGFALAFVAVALGGLVQLGWGCGFGLRSPQLDHLHRLVGYQGFLLLPLLGVGSYLFPRFFSTGGHPGGKPKGKMRGGPPARRAGSKRGIAVWLTAGIILVSFLVEVWGSVRWGNALRISALVVWGLGAAPAVFRTATPTTRAWALRVGLLLVAGAFACRVIWPREIFAFEHLLFLGGFSQIILLVADRVAYAHATDPPERKPRSLRWRWIVWLLLLTAATRASADLIPSTRISHHIYAAVMLVIIFAIWWVENGKWLRWRGSGDRKE